MSNHNISFEEKQDLLPNLHKFEDKHYASEMLSSLYRQLGETSKASRLLSCGTYLEFGVTRQGSRKLYRANFCKVRLCPMCMWRRSKKIFSQVSRVLDCAEEQHGYKFLFLTLTVSNMASNDLLAVLNAMYKAVWRFTHNSKRFARVVKGWFRTLEITRNKDTKEYHPHLHMILAVEPDYFTSPDYIRQSKDNPEWSNLWADAMGLDYNPICYIQAVNDSSNDYHLRKNKARREVSKYCAKPDIFTPSRGYGLEAVKDTLYTLDKVLHGRRLVAFGGVLKRIAKDLKFDDPENGDLADIHGDLRPDLFVAVERYRWRSGVYVSLGSGMC